MASLFSQRFEARARPAFLQQFGVDVTIVDGSYTTNVTALVSGTTFETSDGMVSTSIETRDYLIQASKFIINGARTTPARGMKITEGSKTYTITEPAGQSAFAYDDENQQILRIHTVLTATT